MSIYASIDLVTAILLFLIGQYVLLKNPKQLINRVFYVFILSATVWSFAMFLFRTSCSFTEANFWYHIPFYAPVPILFLHFVVAFVEELKNRKTLFVLKFNYLLVALYIIKNIFIFRDYPVRGESGWDWVGFDVAGREIPLIDTIIYYGWVLWTILLLIFGFFKLIRFYKSTANIVKKKQLRIMFIFVIAEIFIISIAYLFPGIKFDITQLGVFFIVLVISYAITRYKLFVISPETVANDIISTMSDGLILADTTGKIMNTNTSICKLSGYNEGELKGKNVNSLIDRIIAKQLIKDVEEEKTVRSREIYIVDKRGRKIPTEFSGSYVKLDGERVKGIVFTIRDIRDRKESEDKIKLKNQELSEINTKLERMNEFMVGREKKMREMKDEIEHLKKGVLK